MKELGIYQTFDNRQFDVKFDSENNCLIATGPLGVSGTSQEIVIEHVYNEDDAEQAFKQFFKTKRYKGFVITAAPDLLASGEWSTKVVIRKQNGSVIKPFSTANKWDYESEADRHCLNLGKQIVDGQAEFSVDDL
ncbi:DUF6566 family protein [Desulfobacula sp.]|uniref:DUF6566 domain-containing protein n=1 Tax=Candidatus Desulfatibia vada TaxID=2841696 RepID=A0A8J6P3W1_9BACT|nr:hypothetical protein [Candidatus Desulfatibia vada]MBL6996529.1 hypothetical protein [Desulfobacula sp.]